MTWPLLMSDPSSALTWGQILTLIGAMGTITSIIMAPFIIAYYTKKEPSRRIMPDPLNVRDVKELATLVQLEALEERLDKRFDKSDSRFEDVFKAIGNEGRRVDMRINTLSERLCEFIGRFDQSQRRHKDD